MRSIVIILLCVVSLCSSMGQPSLSSSTTTQTTEIIAEQPRELRGLIMDVLRLLFPFYIRDNVKAYGNGSLKDLMEQIERGIVGKSSYITPKQHRLVIFVRGDQQDIMKVYQLAGKSSVLKKFRIIVHPDHYTLPNGIKLGALIIPEKHKPTTQLAAKL